jgi:hypothetical protein
VFVAARTPPRLPTYARGNVIVDYSFPNTSHASQRLLVQPEVSVSFEGPDDQGHEHRLLAEGLGSSGFSLRPSEREGTWTLPYSMTCLNGAFRHEVTARTCSGETAVDGDDVIINTKPSVSASVGGVKANGGVDTPSPMASRTPTKRVNARSEHWSSSQVGSAHWRGCTRSNSTACGT